MRKFCRDDEITDNREGLVDAAYLAEVDRMTTRRVKLHARREAAAAALVRAETAVHEAKVTRDRRAIREAWRVVKQRQEELAAIERLMTSVPGASSSHRGTRSLWPTHAQDAVARVPDRDRDRTSDGLRHPITKSTRSEVA